MIQFNLSFFCCLCFFFVISKKPLPNPSHKIYVQGFLRDLALTLGSLMHSALIFLYVVEIQLHSFACGYSLVSIQFVEKLVFPPMNHLGIPVENQLIMNIRNYLWDLTFTLLICMSVLRLEPHSLEACSFTVSFEVGKYEFFKFVLFKNCFSYSECCISIRILGSFCFLFPQKSKLRF